MSGAFDLETARLASLLRDTSAWRTRSGITNKLMEQAADRLELLQAKVDAQAFELAALNNAMDAVGAGGVEPLRRGADDAR